MKWALFWATMIVHTPAPALQEGRPQDVKVLKTWSGQQCPPYHFGTLPDPAARYDLILDDQEWNWFWKTVGKKAPEGAPDFSKEMGVAVFQCSTNPRTGIIVDQVQEFEDRAVFRYHGGGEKGSRSWMWLVAQVPRIEKRWVFIEGANDGGDPKTTWGWIDRNDLGIRVGAEVEPSENGRGAVLMLPAPLLERVYMDLSRRKAGEQPEGLLRAHAGFHGGLLFDVVRTEGETRLSNPRVGNDEASVKFRGKQFLLIKPANARSEPVGAGFRCRFDFEIALADVEGGNYRYRVHADITALPGPKDGGRPIFKSQWTGPRWLD